MRSSRSAISCRARTSCVMSREIAETPTTALSDVENRRVGHRDVDDAAVLAHAGRLEPLDAAALAHLRQDGIDLVLAVRRRQEADVAADGFLRRDSRRAASRRYSSC